MTEEDAELRTWAESGHQQVWHVVLGEWEGPKEYRRLADSPNFAECGMRVSRRLASQPDSGKALCPNCTRFLTQPEESLPAPQSGLIPGDENFTYSLVRLGGIFTDYRIQRPQQAGWVDRIAAEFDPEEFALVEPWLADRETCEGGRGPGGERYAVLDSQHKLAAAFIKYGPDALIRAKVFSHLSLARQARIFRMLNSSTHRHAVKVLDDHRVALAEGDPEATVIEQLLGRYGLRNGSSGTDGNVACIGHLRRINKAGQLDQVLDILTAAWGNRAEAYHAQIVSGIFHLLTKARSEGKPVQPDVEHLKRALKKIPPEYVVTASKATANGGTAGTRAAQRMLAGYNQYLHGRPRIDGF